MGDRMADDEEMLEPTEFDLAIAKAGQKSPKMAKAREKIERLTGGFESEEGMRLLAAAIRRLMHTES